MVDMYDVLRKIDVLRVVIDNLQREVISLQSTDGRSSTMAYNLITEKQFTLSWEELFAKECDRINGLSKMLNFIKEANSMKSS